MNVVDLLRKGLSTMDSRLDGWDGMMVLYLGMQCSSLRTLRQYTLPTTM